MPATITVFRPSEGYRDRWRRYSIEVDGSPVGRLARGSELTVDVASGKEVSVRARIDYTGSPTWCGTLSDGERARIEVAAKPAHTFIKDWFSTDRWIRISRAE